ncbi:MAG: OadG family protein [Treponema sp.]|nr:OadG family protein [Treponema sp.]
MTISDMLGQSGLLTVLGMSVVFSFIIILIMCMGLLHAVVRAFKLDKSEVKTTKSSKAAAPAAVRPAAAAVDQGAVIAAIAAAIREKESV